MLTTLLAKQAKIAALMMLKITGEPTFKHVQASQETTGIVDRKQMIILKQKCVLVTQIGRLLGTLAIQATVWAGLIQDKDHVTINLRFRDQVLQFQADQLYQVAIQVMGQDLVPKDQAVALIHGVKAAQE